ncbi:dockerin type I repeat-containing protein [Ruminococcus sp.]|uniref:dockerin type I repeat-containing protein n=1 Tax=Ruminococcus sp. TaxID=41978 RepID=UPI0025DA97CB|nr:dockerin type I repeat-containing protein [Ruminococcus sp.]
MKKQMTKFTGVVLAVVITAVSLPMNAAYADNPASDNYEMSILTADTKKEVVSISSLDTAERDVTITVGVYISSEQWSEEDYIEIASANWAASDPSYISFSNILDLTATQEQRSIPYSGGTYLSRYESYCLLNVVESKKYGLRELSRPISVTTTERAYDPVFGAEIYQAGKNQVKFSFSYYETYADMEADVADNSKGRMKQQECLCDVKYNNDGSAYYEYSYVRQDTYETDTAIGYLPAYDPTLPEGEVVPGMSDYFLWMYSGSSATSFFGESSDEFPLVTFDITLKQGTPDGMYTVDFPTDTYKTFLSGKESKTHFPASANGLTIIVDENAPRMTEPPVTTTQPPETTTEVSETTASISEDTDISSDTQTTMSTAQTQTTTKAKLQPVFLNSNETIYVDELYELDLFNTSSDDQIAWISADQSVAVVEDTLGAISWILGKKPGITTIYAVVGGKAISCEITVLERDVPLLYGDVNQDSGIALDDLVYLFKYVTGSVKLDYYGRRNADCNVDAIVDGSDAMVLQKFLVRMLIELPYSQE